jgi:hypothetical protein
VRFVYKLLAPALAGFLGLGLAGLAGTGEAVAATPAPAPAPGSRTVKVLKTATVNSAGNLVVSYRTPPATCWPTARGRAACRSASPSTAPASGRWD